MSDNLAHTGYEDSTLSPALATSMQQRQPNPTPFIESAPHAPQNGTQRLLGAATQRDEDEEVVGLRAELAAAQERWRQVLAILHD